MKKIRIILSIMLAFSMLAVCAAGTSAMELSVVVTSDSDAVQTVTAPTVYYGSAIVLDGNTGAVIYEHDAYTKRAMASTTKIMTAILALEQNDLGREIVITEQMLEYDESGSTKLGLSIGDRITMHDLIVGMLLLSGNDCAQSLAVAIGGSLDGFASMMNERASQIGMMDTHFITPSGLDDEEHYSTAYDMALLAQEAIKNEDLMSICRIKTTTVNYGNPTPVAHYVSTHNYLLEGMSHEVKGCDGIKTGYTDTAGFCLVSHVQRDDISLICVTLGAPTYWSYHSDLYEYAFSQYVRVTAQPDLGTTELMVIGGAKQTVGIECVTGGSFPVLKSQVGGISSKITLNAFEYAPISENQVVGYVTYYYGTLQVAQFPIRATENIDCVTNDWLSAYIDAIKFNME